MESKIQILENRVKDQDRIIDSQSRELENLRPQVQGKEELVRYLEEARSILAEDDSSEYDDYRRRRAA